MPIPGGVLIWIFTGMLVAACLCIHWIPSVLCRAVGNDTQRLQILKYSFLRRVDLTAPIQAAKMVGLYPPQTVLESNLTVDCQESTLSKPFLRHGLRRDVERVPLASAFS